MDVPNTCEKWAQMMERGTTGEPAILENLRQEQCIHKETTDKFFEALAKAGEPKSAAEAKSMAYHVVKNDQKDFTCQRRQVPDNIFAVLFRLEDVPTLQYRIPDVLKKIGINADDLISGRLPDDELLVLTDEYDGPVSLGNDLGIVWITDEDAVSSIRDDLREVADRLGILSLLNAHRCVLCVFRKDKTGKTFHVPSALDAIKNPEFKVVEDCSADCGETQPLTPGKEGLPEAVHSECEVIPTVWKLGFLK